MKTFLIALVALFTPVAATASDFTGPRVEITAGVSDLTNARDLSDVNYGVTAGLDAPIGDSKFIIGGEVNVDNFFAHRDYGASVRVGYILSPSVLIYGKGGYAKLRDLDGFRVGGGLELALSENVFTKAEYRYSDFEAGVGRHQGLVGVGLRF